MQLVGQLYTSVGQYHKIQHKHFIPRLTKPFSMWKLGFPRDKINSTLCMDCLQAEMDKPETKSKLKNIRGMYRDINYFRRVTNLELI